MKIVRLLPTIAYAQDDTSTLLSLKVHTSLETGVDHLLDAVGSRNVTQMSSLLQNLVEETIGDGVGELDTDVKSALDLIKKALLGDIRDSLQESHCISQKSLHDKMLCFEECENKRAIGKESCGSKCDGMQHKQCREEVCGTLYHEHIRKCRALDSFVENEFKDCPEPTKKCCYLPHTTWNCEGGGQLCDTRIANLKVDNGVGVWMNEQLNAFRRAYESWKTLYADCRDSYRAYVTKDAECDCLQAECEAENCRYDSCHFLNCEDDYHRCWGACEKAVCQHYPAEDCKEKDRKIDWAATEKIECYVDVLLANPTKDELLEKCGTDTCINKWREEAYNNCNKICPEVDYGKGALFEKLDEARDECRSAGQYTGSDHDCIDAITTLINQMGDHARVEGDEEEKLVGSTITTNHRGHGEDRCTAHLDIDWQKPPCCSPCEARDPKPCEEPYMQEFYGQYDFLKKEDIPDLAEAKCYAAAGEHTWDYCYNLCDCVPCPVLPDSHCPTCTPDKACAAGNSYNYAPHHLAQEVTCETRDSGEFRDRTKQLTADIKASQPEPEQ